MTQISADFTIADVLAWARTKPADERYDYIDGCGGCALCQFLIETGRATQPKIWPKWFSARKSAWADGFNSEKVAYSAELEWPLQAGSFGALVAALEKLCPETPVTKSDWLAIDAYMADIESVAA